VRPLYHLYRSCPYTVKRIFMWWKHPVADGVQILRYVCQRRESGRASVEPPLERRANPTHEIADRFSDVDPRDHAVSRQTSGDRVAAARISQRPERRSGVDAPRSVDVAKRFSLRDVVRSRILAFGRLACSVDFIADWKRVAVQNKCAWL